MNKIRNLVEGKKSQIAGQTVNKTVYKCVHIEWRLKAAYQEERLLKWKEHFKNLLGKLLDITEKSFIYIVIFICIYNI